MSNFDPNDDLDTAEQADAYINWCATNFMRLSQGTKRTYRTAIRCAAWLFVVASAQLHLDEEVSDQREELLEQLAMYQALGRAVERQVQHLTIERLVVLRSSLDCWEPMGAWAGHLLEAARAAVSALMLIEIYPMVDPWELDCADVWALLDAGSDWLRGIDEGELSFADFAVRPHEGVIAKYTWQKVNNLTRGAGLRVNLGPN